jgi:YgiT-type zinc finger domain-containing protein
METYRLSPGLCLARNSTDSRHPRGHNGKLRQLYLEAGDERFSALRGLDAKAPNIGGRLERGIPKEEDEMRCRVCAGQLESRITDLPFKIGDSSIVILRSLPVLQCRQCGETELEQATMSRVDQLLAAVDASAELEVIRYAA